MPTRNTPPWRAWRLHIAALALSSVLAAPARPQDGEPPPQLRGDVAEPAAPAEPSALAPPLAARAENAGPTAPLSPEGAAPPAPGAREGQPAKKKRAPAKRPVERLPTLEPYRGADRAGMRGGSPAFDPSLVLPPTVAAMPVEPAKKKPKPDDNPFAPLGITVGDLRLTPYVEQDLGYSSNPNLAVGPTRGSLFETTDLGLGVQSDWSRNDLHAALHGGYADYFGVPEANAPNGSGTLEGRLEATRDLSFDAEGRFNVAAQTPGSVSLPTGVVLASTQRPLYETFGATLGGEQKFGDLGLALHGAFDRTTYQNATLANGQIDDLASDDFDDWGLRARVSYQVSPLITPFIESVIDRRIYDSFVDSNGYERDSVGALLRAGATLALTGQLTGEISGGYGARHYEDPRLPPLQAPLIDASLIWTVTPLTTATFKATTTLADTTTRGASGAVSRIYSIDLSHALRRYLTLDATASLERDYYVGIPQVDTSTTLGLSANYNVTRDIVLRASANRTIYTSNVPGANYAANVFLIGLRLQR